MEDKKLQASIQPISIDKELKASFLDYAMSVIVSRALPDIRDGLKPVHRRVLFAMHNLGLYKEKPYRKSATVVGEIIGNYHPHGNEPIYQAMVGMVQDFVKRYPLLDGQGNWGSIDGDNAAAYRYTEVRMAKIARDILEDIDKDTVDFTPNYDESRLEPVVLPSKVPLLLINGSSGIAVGMATSIPPHNLGEVVTACIALLKDPELSDKELFSIVPAPDFPGGGVICGLSGVMKAYKTGHGSVKVRGVVEVEENGNRESLIIKQIPYQVNKSDLITKIAELAKNKIIEGIVNIRDESGREGIRVVIEVKRGEIGKVVLNQLFKHTALESNFSMIMLAIADGRPVIFTLREMIMQFLEHRQKVITRRCQYELKKSEARAHILIGLIKALESIDQIIELIKGSKNQEEASNELQARFDFSNEQTRAILDMRLSRLTGLESDKIHAEMNQLQQIINNLRAILADPKLLNEEIIKELEAVHAAYADPRLTKIDLEEENITDLDLIPDDSVVVTLTQKGYVKRVKMENYNVQHRGGRGKRGIADLTEHDDLIQDVFVARNHDDLLFFTNLGRVYSSRVFQMPEGSRTARGRAVINLLPLVEGERVLKLLCTRDIANSYVILVTSKGVIKKTEGQAFAKVRSSGIIAIQLREGDELAFCALSSGNDEILLASSSGQGIRFNESEVRAMGRQAEGVRGITLRGKNARVVGLEVVKPEDQLLFATSRGYGKQVSMEEFRLAHRGGMGVRTIPTDSRNGVVIGVVKVNEQSNLLLIDQAGVMIRLDPKEIRVMHRQAMGIRLIKLDKEQTLATVVAFDGLQEDDENLDSGLNAELIDQTPRVDQDVEHSEASASEYQEELILADDEDDENLPPEA